MRYSMGYDVLLVEKKIVMTKDFARKAAIIGTEEYTRYMQLRDAYVVVKKVVKTFTSFTNMNPFTPGSCRKRL